MKEKIVLVIAGTKLQFDDFIGELLPATNSVRWTRTLAEAVLDGTRYRWVRDLNGMRGFHGVEVKFIGTYSRLDEIAKMIEYAPSCSRA